ncbi:Uncharacterised protein [Mycobacteroides abscessus subsp. bolletii]|nr:Uncharacterised protein [Mycobacteroides abscessus subsp. bolletii]SKX37625.1 Uncharacterised protein [Mycobacteroides abscessus subsp. bolletii]
MGDNLIEADASADLWQRQAFADTVFLASQHGMPLSPGSDLGLHHLMQMRIRAPEHGGKQAGTLAGVGTVRRRCSGCRADA